MNARAEPDRFSSPPALRFLDTSVYVHVLEASLTISAIASPDGLSSSGIDMESFRFDNQSSTFSGGGNRDNSSAALAFPFEIIETILLGVPAPDLAIAASNLPWHWCTVLGNSRRLWKHVMNWPSLYLEIGDKLWSPTVILDVMSETDYTYCTRLKDGLLVVRHHEEGGIGLIFASTSSQTFRVLDSEKTEELHGRISLYDLAGSFVCDHEVGTRPGKPLRKDLGVKHFRDLCEECTRIE